MITIEQCTLLTARFPWRGEKEHQTSTTIRCPVMCATLCEVLTAVWIWMWHLSLTTVT